jgi:hypothetical protein
MRKIILLLSVLSLYACTNNNANSSKEQTKIWEVIESENKSFYAKNHAEWSKHYLQTEQVYWACVEPEITLRASGWKDLSNFVASWMKENPVPLDYAKADFKNKDKQIIVDNNMAFVSFTSTNNEENGTVKTLRNNRTMQKVDGLWKIISMTSYPADSPRQSTANVYLHGK